MSRSILQLTNAIRAVPFESKTLEDIDFIKLIDDLFLDMEVLSKKVTAEEFMELAEVFDNEELYFDLDTVYVNCIEAMPDYPPAKLFTSPSSNLLLKELRESCFLGGDFVPHPSIPIFSDVFHRIAITDDLLYNILDTPLLAKCNLHELRLFIEVIFTIVHKEDPVDSMWYATIEEISLYLDKAAQKAMSI